MIQNVQKCRKANTIARRQDVIYIFYHQLYWVACALFPVTQVSIKADAIIINRLYFPTFERPWKFSYQLNFYPEKKYLKENHILYFAVGSKNIGRCIFSREYCLVGGGKALNAL